MFTHIIRAIVLAAARRGVGRSAALLLAAVGAAGLMSAPTLAQGNGGHSVSVSSAVDGAVNNFQPGEDVVVTLSITSDISQYFNATLGGHRYKAVSDGVDLDTAIGGWRRTSPVTFNSCGPAPLSSGTSDIQVANLVVAPAPDQGFSTLSCVISFNATIPSDATPGSYTLNTDTLNGTYTRVDDPNTAGDQSVGDTAFTFAPVSYAFDIIADQVPSVSLSGPGGVLANAPFTVTATFSEPVTGLTSGEITVTGGSVTNVTAIGGGEGGGSVNWQIEITPSGTGTVNVTVQANAAEDGLNQGNTASDLSAFTIGSPPTLTASIIGNPAAPGGALTVRFVLTNTDSSNALSAGQFTIDVDSSLAGTTVTSVPAGGFCGGSSSAVNAGNGVAVFSSLGLAASGSCTFDVPLAIGAGAAGGTYPITVTGLSYSLGGVSSSINVLAPSLQISGAEGAGAPASFTKTFLSASAARGGTIDVRYDVFAPELEGLTAISFTDDFDAALSGLTAISLPGADICGAGSSLTGTSTMTLAGGTLAAGGSCSFTVTLQLPATGTGGTITSTTSGLAGTADSGAVNLAGVSDSFLLPILAPGVLITGPSANRGVGLPFELTVTFSEPVTGFSQAGFTLVTNAALSNFTADSATVYTVDVTPAAAGAVEIGIGADQAFDTDTNGNIASQTYQVQAVAAEGDLDVAFNGQLIVDASAVISDALGTRFAPLDPSAGAVVRTYTITNSGTGPVNLTGGAGSQVVLTNGTAFTVSAQPGDTALAAGESTTFALSFDPGSVAVFNDTVTIAHDAPNEAPYDFAIQGEGVTAPELDVSGNGVAIANNDLTPQSADLTDFGTINAGTFRIRTYGLQNTGGSDLIFDATPVTILNDSAGVFTVSSQPAGPIASGSFADMTIRFFSADAGNYSALVSIASNDADEDPYQFQIQAQATGVQEVELQGNSLEIVAGDSSASVADDTDFSGVKVGETATATFTIRNTGTTPLALSPAPVERDGPGTAGTTTVDVVGGSSDFTITSQPAASVTAGGSTTFTVQYSPSAAGAATATLAFGTDDLDEPRYAFTVAGLGTVPEIAVAGLGGADIANTDATPEAGDGTDFGATGFSAGAPITRTFTITNSGDAVLALGANAVSLSGAGVGDWTVTTQPATTVAPNGGTTTFEISFDPTEQLVRTATVSIANDDANEAPFTFAVQGTGADDAAPAGYTASFDQGVVNAANQGAISFTFAGGEAQADYAYTISSSGGGAAVTGGGTLATSTDTIAGLDLSSLTDGLLTLSVTLTDNAANQGAAATATVTKDVGAPGVSITTASSDPVSGAFTATFTFTEAVTGFTLGDIAVGNGAASSFSTTSASVYTATITPAANGAVTVDVAAAAAIDAAGNANTAAAQFSITNDATAPGLAITTASSDPVSGAFTATFTFTEAVTGFTLGDIAVGNGAASSLSTTSASVYTATITPAANGAVTVDVPAAAANDAAGNANTAAAQFSITNDATAPGLAITTASSDPVSGAFTATFTFTEAVTGFVLGDIAVGNGAASSFSTTSPSVYTATITPAADGAVTVDVAANAANDAAGNANTAATQFSITRDATAPTITFTADPVAPVINGGQVQLTVTFSESVTGFDATDLNVVNGAVEGFSGSGAVYIINVRPVADGPFSVGVGAGAAVDGAGNGNIANQYSVTADLTAPTATISSTASDPVSGVFSISVAFSEPVTGFEASSLTVGNGSASNVAGGGAAYTADITPGADGPVTVDLPANAVLDVASNGNVAPAQFTIQADGTVPGVSITSGSSDPVSGAFAITVTFTEAVTGFVLGDIAVGNGAASSFSTTSQSVYTATITPAAEGAVTVDVPPAAATDAAGNANTAAAQLIRQNDVTAPGLAITTASSNPVSGAFTATFTFTESVTGFALGDIAVGNGAASSLAGS
ncbi:MAG: Ig-like domain-containing protein, partial [Oceanicaulis sp.]